MSKFVSTEYGKKKQILKFPDHYVAISVTVDDTGVKANAEGKKIVPAGTIVGNDMLNDLTKKAKKAVTTAGASSAEGVLFEDVDVSHGAAAGAMLVHGFVDVAKLPVAPTAEEIATLKQITFLK